jgi:hypothetical protein
VNDDSKAKELCAQHFYDKVRKEFVVLNGDGDWCSHAEGGYKRILASMWFSKKVREGDDSGAQRDPLSQVDRAMYDAAHLRGLDYCGRLAGCPKGIHVLPGVGRILVTQGPSLYQPDASGADWPNLRAFFGTLLIDDSAQMPTFIAWLAMGVRSLYAHKPRPGQAVVFAGPRNCGKSLAQQLITEILGGRMARPYQYMSGLTPFNSDLFQAEHQIIEDDQPSTRLEERRNFGSKIKEITANERQRLHAKGRDAIMLPVFWRATISVNDEPENLMMLPPMDDSLADKLIIFRAKRAVLPCDTDTTEGRDECWKTLVAEIPALVAHLLNSFDVAPAMRDGRYGFRAFHHPEIIASLCDLAPESRLLSIVDTEIFGALSTCTEWEGTSQELERRLIGSDSVAYDARKLFTYPTACGVYLSRLLVRLPQRFERVKTEKHNLWKLKKDSFSQKCEDAARMEDF